VDLAVGRLYELDQLGLESHPRVFDEIDSTLRRALDGSDGAATAGS
jgi:hypothetical protein